MGKRSSPTWLLLSSLAVSFVACSLGTRPEVSPENTPPEVSFVVAPPAYTRDPSLTLNIKATATFGIGAVYVQVGEAQTQAAQGSDGSWQATITLPAAGHNTITIWAVDKGSPAPNSGQGLGGPYELTADVDYDPTPPSIAYDGTYASYVDERNLELVVDQNGLALTPPQYQAGTTVPIPAGGNIYKSSTRLSGGSSMNASELESTNAANIPVLRFMALADPRTAAPIQAATYLVQLTCSQACSAPANATGSLMPSPTTSTTGTLFDLPLSAETIPGLAQIQGAATLSISITVTDAAGNSTTSNGFNFVFHVIGPPVAIIEDTNYPSLQAKDSIYGPYRLTDNSYEGLWSGSAQNYPDGKVRLLRYLVTNPTDQQVAFQVSYAQAASGSWRMYENWTGYEVPDPHGLSSTGTVILDEPLQAVPISLDGFTFYNTMYWAIPYGSVGIVAHTMSGNLPCASPTTNWLMHLVGDTQNEFICKNATSYAGPSNKSGVYSQSDVGTTINQAVAALGGQEQPANMDSTSHWYLVPAASGDGPGMLVLYLTRPVTAPRSIPLQWNAYAATAPAANHYQTWDYMIWDAYQHGLTPYALYPGYDSFVANRAGSYLTYAADQVFGSLTGT